MSRRAFKKEFAKDLVEFPFEELSSVVLRHPYNSVVNALFSFICSGNKELRWRAVSAFGVVLPYMADEDLEGARVVMRRFLWSLNDESGGIGWGAPEAMAEIMVNSEVLRKEYLHMLLSYAKEDGDELFQDGNHLELPLLQQGLLWAIARVAEVYPDEVRQKDMVDDLLLYLQSEDKEVVCHSLRVLSFLAPVSLPLPFLERTLPQSFEIYKDGSFRQILLEEVLKTLCSS